MTLLVAWLLFPAACVLLAVGNGLLIERATGRRLDGVLLMPLGLAAIVAVSQLTTFTDPTAELTTPLLVALALAGFVLGRARLRDSRPDPWAAAAAGAVFAVFAAPIVLSGEATFAGYTVLGDTSIHFIGVDYVMEHGRDVGGLAPSSYELSLENYFGSTGYPAGAVTAVGALRPLAGLDIAWVFQPFLAILATALTLALYSLISTLVASRPVRAVVAGVAGQSTMLLAYALQGSVKEVGAAWCVALIGALVPQWTRHAAGGVRPVVPLAVASAAGLGVIGIAVAPWLGPVLLAALVIAYRARVGARRVALAAGAFVALAALLALPTLTTVADYVRVVPSVVTGQAEMGNLLRPLDRLQAFGIWLSGDYRLEPTNLKTETHLLIAVAAVGVALGLVWTARRRAWSVLFFFAVSLLGFIYVTARGSPWADGKAIVIVSPAVLLCAMLGAAALWSWRRSAGALLAAPIVLGVVWSNALAYHDVSLAPRDRMAELEQLGERVDGQGPTLYLEFEEFAKHFLRHGDPESPSEGWQRRHAEAVQVRTGAPVRQGFSNDIDQFGLSYLNYWKTIVLRRSPVRSRPPAPYRLVWSGRFYEQWTRPTDPASDVLEHFPLGDDPLEVGARPLCRDVRSIASRARDAGGRLAYVEREQPLQIIPTETAYPRGWVVDATDGRVLNPRGPGVVADSVEVRRPGRYDVWVEGSFGRSLDVEIDGRRVGSTPEHLDARGQYAHVATLDLDAGRRVIRLERGGGNLSPGNGGTFRRIGPIVVARRDPEANAVRTIAPRSWRELCGRHLDWIEIVRPAGATSSASLRAG